MTSNMLNVEKLIKRSVSLLFIFWCFTVFFPFDKAPVKQQQKTEQRQKALKSAIEVSLSTNFPEASRLESTMLSLKELRTEEKTKANTKVEPKKIEQKELIRKPMSIELLANANINLIWPSSMFEKEKLADYFYKCLGVTLAILKGNELVRLDHRSTGKTSQWLRDARTTLTLAESNLITGYGLTGTPVRLFPRVFDIKLIKLLDAELKLNEFLSLTGKYKIRNDALYLTEIQLNNVEIKKEWRLKRSC